MPRKKFTELVRTDWAGLVLAILVGLVAYWVASYDQAIDSLVVGLILGMVIRTIMGDRQRFLPGLELAPKIFIPLGVIFYGINLKFNRLIEIPAIIWLQLVVSIIAIFVVAIYLGRLLKIRDRNSLLIATGTAICGASAIAIATPVVKADSEEGAKFTIVIPYG